MPVRPRQAFSRGPKTERPLWAQESETLHPLLEIIDSEAKDRVVKEKVGRETVDVTQYRVRWAGYGAAA